MSQQAFRVGPAANLPDCRAYEMVSPVYKDSSDVTTESGYVSEAPRVSADGQSLTAWTLGGFAGATGNASLVGSPYLFGRTGSGWEATPMELSASQFLTTGQIISLGGSVDDRSEFVMAHGLTRPSNTIDIYRIQSDGSVLDIGPALPPSAPSGSVTEVYGHALPGGVGVSADGSHTFFATVEEHWPFDATEAGWQSVYEYAGAGNTTPLLVGVNNKDELINQCGTALGGLQDADMLRGTNYAFTQMNHNDISADGRVVFFTALRSLGTSEPPRACSGSAPPVDEVYARIDNGLADAHTVAISEPSKEDCEQCDTEPGVLAGAIFEGASEDGSKVCL
jgi:hypothetical protein